PGCCLAPERCVLERCEVTPLPVRVSGQRPAFWPGRWPFVYDCLFDGKFAMMVLYSGTTCPYSQRCRFVLFEKGMDFEIRDVDLYNKPEDISVMNPYGQVPILTERDLVLYESN